VFFAFDVSKNGNYTEQFLFYRFENAKKLNHVKDEIGLMINNLFILAQGLPRYKSNLVSLDHEQLDNHENEDYKNDLENGKRASLITQIGEIYKLFKENNIFQ